MGHSVYESSISPQDAVDVMAYPAATLVNLSYPNVKRAGEAITIAVTIRNDGGDGYCNCQLENRTTGVTITAYGETLAEGASFSVNLPAMPTMPNNDWLLRLRYGHQEYGEQYWDGSRDFTIQLSIPTNLTLTITQTRVAPGELVSFSGKLARPDTGIGVGGQTVIIQIGPSWTQVATATTDSTGTFSGTFTAPTTPGTYSYQAYYGGTAMAAFLLIVGWWDSLSTIQKIGVAASIITAIGTGIVIITKRYR